MNTNTTGVPNGTQEASGATHPLSACSQPQDIVVSTPMATICNGFHLDCGEDAVVLVGPRSTPLCGECAEEYQNYLLSIGWTLQTNTEKR